MWNIDWGSFFCLWVYHLLERLSFLHWIAFAVLKITWKNNFTKIICAYFCGFLYHFLYWVPYTVPLPSVSILPTISHHLDYCGYKISSETGQTGSSHFILPFQNCFNYFGSFVFYIYFGVSLSISIKNFAAILIETALNLYDNLIRLDIFTVLNFPIHEHGMSLHLFR